MTTAAVGFTWRARVRVDVGDPVPLGADVHGQRRLVPIVGGAVTGEWRGRVLSGGADWQTVLADGSVLIDARYPVELDTVGTVVFRARGARDAAASDDTFCTTLVVDGPDDATIVASVYATVGRKSAGQVVYDVFEVR